MKKIFLIISIFSLLILSACTQQSLPINNWEKDDKILQLEQQIKEMQASKQDSTKQISDLQKQSQNNLDLKNKQLEELKKETEEFKIQLEQIKNIKNITEPLLQSDEVRKIVDKISLYCTKYNIPKCLPIDSYSTIFLDEKYSVMKVNNMSSSYLLTKKNNEWNVSIVGENNICETGSDSPDLFEYCKKLEK